MHDEVEEMKIYVRRMDGEERGCVAKRPMRMLFCVGVK